MLIDLIVDVCWCLHRSTMKCPNSSRCNSSVRRASIVQSIRDARWPWCTLDVSFASFRRLDFSNLATSLETISVRTNISTDYLHNRRKQMSKDLVLFLYVCSIAFPSPIRMWSAYGINVREHHITLEYGWDVRKWEWILTDDVNDTQCIDNWLHHLFGNTCQFIILYVQRLQRIQVLERKCRQHFDAKVLHHRRRKDSGEK